jgi:hypothetical protein
MTRSQSIQRFMQKYTALLALVYFALMSVVMTWPLVLRMSNAMVGQTGDNIYFVWMINWIKRALFELHVNPFDVWFLNFPEGWNMAYTEITPAQLALALPFSFTGGPAFGYNMALLLSFVLSGFAMFLWVRRLTGNAGAALVAGTIFAFLPYRFAHFLIGHLNLSGTQWFPFYFMGFFEVLGAVRPKIESPRLWPAAVLTGVSLGLIGLTSQYYLYMTLLVSAFIAGVYLLLMNRALLRDGRFWRQVGLSLLAAAPLVALAVAPFVGLAQQGGLPDRGLAVVRQYSASPTDFLLPSTDHFLWGRWVGAHFNRDLWIESTLYIGMVTLVLAVIAWVRRKQFGQAPLLILLLVGSLLSIILAMGTDLHWNAQPVELAAPAFLQNLIGRETIPLLLPGYFLFQYFPFYAKLRALMRFGIFALVFFSAGAGLGAGWLLSRVKLRRQPWAAALLLALVFVDFYPGQYGEFAEIETRAVDVWLAEQPGEGAVIQFPFIMGEDQDQTYNTLIHGRPFVGGFFNAFPPVQYARIMPVMEHFPDEASVALLPELGVQYVLVDRDSYDNIEQVRAEAEYQGLVYVDQFGDQLVFEVTE